MSVALTGPTSDRVILQNVSWKTYERLLKDLKNFSSPRLAFDRGVLEIMSPHLEHESVNRSLAAIVEIALEELDLDFENAGSTTFKRESQKRGFEPDSCFYIEHAGRIRNRKKIDLERDPPPDLLIEVDLTRDSLNKFPLYASLGVPEVWRYSGRLEIWLLDQGRYVRRQNSHALPVLSDKFIFELLSTRRTTKRPTWLRGVRNGIRARLG